MRLKKSQLVLSAEAKRGDISQNILCRSVQLREVPQNSVTVQVAEFLLREGSPTSQPGESRRPSNAGGLAGEDVVSPVIIER